MADNRTEDAAQELDTGTAATLDVALGANWDKWQKHVVAHVPAPDEDNDNVAEMSNPVVPLLVYGDGPNSYISTDIDAGQVVVRDGRDKTGRAWKWPLADFMRFVARAHGKRLPGEPEEQGDNPYEAAAKQNARTAKLVEAERARTQDVTAGQAGQTHTSQAHTSQTRTGK
jgi:hypothetical protein